MRSIVSEAKKAQKAYAKVSFDKRKALLQTLLDWVVANQAEIGALASRDSGKTSMLIFCFLEIKTSIH
jgi:acyl-CoA reductase-like NAD-dependent aldehyde dehydrogenase